MVAFEKQKVELLAPAGNPEKLKIAIHYGADAVYLSDKRFSLRNFSDNFSLDELEQAIRYAHDRGVNVYAACNLYSRNEDQNTIRTYLNQLGELKPDALIISDPGIILLALQIIPHIPIHLSTQANTTNYHAAQFWKQVGVKRVNAARELSLAEIRDLVEKSDMEVEVFVHGAMCISYSGRCLLSLFMANRHSNQGVCCQPCRFKYAVMEETRPGQYFPIIEDDRGAYIFNSKDLCMIDHIPELIDAGVRSLKIEGRMKGIHYLATVVNTYRRAIDAYYAGDNTQSIRNEWRSELQKVCYRTYSTGFYFGKSDEITPNYDTSVYTPGDIVLAGVVTGVNGRGQVILDVRSKLEPGDAVEILSKNNPVKTSVILGLYTLDGFPKSCAQPGSSAAVDINAVCSRFDLIRKLSPEIVEFTLLWKSPPEPDVASETGDSFPLTGK